MQTAPAEDRDPPQAIPAPLPAQNHPGKKAKKKRKKKKGSKIGESSSSSAVADQHSRGIPPVAGFSSTRPCSTALLSGQTACSGSSSPRPCSQGC
ncbi:hypothetical protein ACJRO7_003090 [Eucalyptus globulus]|uniref:Uncharacterized protein n=1 Tax=Eucalyptus globulus TaxID=34317 RepID=A0ABD3IVC4_EUCGL